MERKFAPRIGTGVRLPTMEMAYVSHVVGHCRNGTHIPVVTLKTSEGERVGRFEWNESDGTLRGESGACIQCPA